MNPKTLAVGLLAAGCLTAAAAGGAYVAVRQNADTRPAPAAVSVLTPAPAASQPVSETEAVIASPAAKPTEAPSALPSTPRQHTPAELESAPTRTANVADRGETSRRSGAARRPNATSSVRRRTADVTPAPAASAPSDRAVAESRPAVAPAPVDPVPEPVRAPEPLAPPEPQFDEVVVPASSVIGLQVDTPLSSERSRVEDRVEARVTRDVSAGGRVGIPAGSRVVGAVTLVERGGKLKEQARLGVRFHTLVLADGREVPLRTEAIFRDGVSPTGESARKIGGAAIGGAILGAIIGGGKGAAIGGAAGAAGGSAAVMAGDRHAATLPAGTVVSVRLTSPATIEVEKR